MLPIKSALEAPCPLHYKRRLLLSEYERYEDEKYLGSGCKVEVHCHGVLHVVPFGGLVTVTQNTTNYFILLTHKLFI